jgi:Gram-negative bacterial TonB protein C-terminal
VTHKLVNSIRFTTILIGLGVASDTLAQTESWQKIAPVGYSFTVLMPTRPVEVFRRIPVSAQDSIPIGIYYSVAGKKRFSFAGFFKTTSVSALSSYENFIAAMEYSFKSNDGTKSLTFEHDLSANGVRSKQYRLKIGEYDGVARFLGTEEVFYALLAVGADESDNDAARFFSSFRLGEVNTNSELSGSGPRVVTMVGSSSTSAASDNSKAPESSENSIATLPPEPWPQPVGPIMGGVLNGKAIHLAVPAYPVTARVLHESGQVSVQVLIDELGNVIRAQAIDGPPSLREAAVAAAWQSRFTPTRLMGQPVRVNGVIIYNFVAR